jgi:DNA-binding response OmpR family regulator
MRCLFVVDEIARFREVAAMLNSRDIAMTMVKEFALAEWLANAGGFDIVIVGTNALSSDSTRFLQRRRERRCPIVAVTGQPDLRRALVDAGADHVVLLPDNGGALKLALAMLVDEPVSMPPRASRRARLWQHLGL